MTPHAVLAQSFLLPELKMEKFRAWKGATWFVWASKSRRLEVCPRCAALCGTVYDQRQVKLKDEPVRGKLIILTVRKRRLWCKSCKKPFTEPLAGILPGRRTTERYRKSLYWAAENFQNLRQVQRAYRCSSNLLYTAVYEQLELRRRARAYDWPKTVGLDEHSFKKNKANRRMEFVSVFVDYPNKKLFEVVEGKQAGLLKAALEHIPCRENVRQVIMDLCTSFRSFVKSFFPNAEVIADKFHVLRLLGPAINRRRKAMSGDRRKNPIGTLLLRNFRDLELHERSAVERFLSLSAELKLIYGYKERLHSFYRIRGSNKARDAFTKMTDELALTPIPELQTLRKTLMSWRKEILRYFETGLTNGRTEGFNNKAKVVKRQAYGYKNFKNYRLRLLNACSH